jgi:hypothetical protein
MNRKAEIIERQVTLRKGNEAKVREESVYVPFRNLHLVQIKTSTKLSHSLKLLPWPRSEARTSRIQPVPMK